MKSVSAELKELMQSERPFVYTAVITLTNGTELTLTEDDLAASGCRITISSGSSSFPVGYAISKCLTLQFFNFDDQYASYDFFGATVEVSASVQLSQTVETIDLDSYRITEPEQYGTTITITGYDDMCLADIPYTPMVVYPASLQNVYRDVCEVCGLIPIASLTNGEFIVDTAPEGMSCRQVLGLIAQLAGGNFIVDRGAARIVKYGAYNASTAHDLEEVISQTASTDDVIVTGVRLKGESEDYDAGASGYMLEFTNELTKSREAQAATLLNNLYRNLRFRPFEQATMSYPLAEFADPCTIYIGGAAKRSYINDITFDFRGTTTLKCVADSPVRNSSKSVQGSTSVQELRRIIKQEKTQRQIAEQNLSDRINAAGGLYSTTETAPDGSEIFYLHDKPELANSGTVWKMTGEAFAVSTDGGETWNAGLTVDGVLLAKILSTVGVDADWIQTGKFDITDGQGNTVFSADKDTGAVYISGDRVYIGNTSVVEAFSDLSGALTLNLSNETQAIPVNNEGQYDAFPHVETDVQVYFSGADVTDDCVITYSEFNCAGTYDEDTNTYTPYMLSSDNGYVTFSARYDTGAQILTANRKFNLFKVRAGEPGTARLYFLDTDTEVIKQTASGVYYPETVYFNAYYRDGDEEQRHPYSGVFKVEITRDGTTWETVEQPSENKTSTSYTPTGEVKAVRCYLYSSAEFADIIYALSFGGDDTAVIDDDGGVIEALTDSRIIEGGYLLDTQTTTTVVDVDALTQQQVFNVLTNNGQTQGLYLLNGRLYINASYIGVGTLASNDGSTTWNLETGELVFNPKKSTIGSGADAETLESVQARITTNATSISTEVTNRQNADTSLSSRITQNANSISSEVENRQSADASLSSRITQNATSISSEVTNRQTAVSSLSSRITQNATDITAEVTNRKNADTSLSSRITQNATSISTEVSDRKSAISGLSTRITQNATSISTEVTNRKNAISSLSSRVTQTESDISSEVTNRKNAITTLTSKVTQNENGIEAMVEARKAAGYNSGADSKARWQNMFSVIKATATEITSKVTSGDVESLIEQKASSIRLKASTLAWDSTYSTMTSNGTLSVKNLYATNSYDKVRTHLAYAAMEFQTRADQTPSGSIVEIDYSKDMWWQSGGYATGSYSVTSSITSESYNHYDMSYSRLQGWQPVSAYRSGDDSGISDQQLFLVLDGNGIVLHTPYGNVSVSSEGTECTTALMQTKRIRATQLNVTGTKSRIAETEDYGERLLYCYETASPMFGDIGEGTIGEDGKTYIQIDPTFSETIQTTQYQVFLQVYGDGKAYVSERHESYFVVSGTPGLSFGWEIKAKQADFSDLRLESDIRQDVSTDDYGVQAVDYLGKARTDYGADAIAHIDDINGGRVA